MGVKQRGATKLLLNGTESAYFGTNFINWGWIGFATAPATATATATATTTTAAAQRQLGGFDHDCCGSTMTAITTLAMVTIAAAMATIAEPMSVLDRPPSPHRELY